MNEITLEYLAAETTALAILVKALLAHKLVEYGDPAKAGEAMIAKLLEAEKVVREQAGESALSLRITEAVSLLIDLAVKSAQALKAGK